MKFNGPDGPQIGEYKDKMETDETGAEATEGAEKVRAYTIPEIQEERLQQGSVVQVHLEDDITRELEWHPGKVTEVDAEKGEFQVHIVIENSREKGGWTDKYTFGAEGKDWRWPSEQAASASQELSRKLDVSAMHRFNETICSLAHELLDESEDLIEKIDSWLISECERLVNQTGPACAHASGSHAHASSSKSSAMHRHISTSSSRSEANRTVQPLTRVPVHVWGSERNKNVRKDGILLQLKDGLHVACNGELLTLSQFEKTAGCSARRARDSIIVSSTGESINRAMSSGFRLARPPNESRATCFKCDKDDNPRTIMLCQHFDTCGGAYHAGCLNPPLSKIPEGDWFCPSCPMQLRQPQMYVVPERNPEELKEGCVIEVSLASDVQASLRHGSSEWVPAKLTRCSSDDSDENSSFSVHAVSNFGGRAESWNKNLKRGDEGKLWRWPEQMPMLDAGWQGSKNSTGQV
jgi:hypothetical protein